MRFIHCSDIHLDSKINELPIEKRNKRRDEIVSTFERLCDYAVKNDVTAVIISGDMFDTEKITMRTLSRVLNAISTASGVDFLYLPGNHEQNGFLEKKSTFPTNLKCFEDSWTTFTYSNVSISGIILTDSNKSTIYDSLRLDSNKINIVALHGQIVGYKTKEDAESISLPMLKEKNIDYLALGHYHSYASGDIDYRGKYAYSGCLDGRGFDEIGEKGFVLLEVNDKLSFNFVKFCSRVLFEFSVSVDNLRDYFALKERIKEVLKQKVSSNDLIKIILTGEHLPDFDIDIENLINFLSGEYFYVKIYDKTSILVKIEDFEGDKSVRGEFVRLVLQSELDNELKDAMLKKGLSALRGE